MTIVASYCFSRVLSARERDLLSRHMMGELPADEAELAELHALLKEASQVATSAAQPPKGGDDV